MFIVEKIEREIMTPNTSSTISFDDIAGLGLRERWDDKLIEMTSSWYW